MHIDRNSIPRSELRHAENMVEMSMGEHDADRLQTMTVNEGSQCGNLGRSRAAGVDDGTFEGVVPHHAAACLEAVEGEVFYVYHSKNPLKHTNLH